MALKIGDAVILNPQREDISNALDSGPQGPAWRLELDNGEDDHIEAVALADGRYQVSFVDRGRRFNAAEAVSAATLETILFRYLDGDADWRDDVEFVAEKSPDSRGRAARRISSKPPAWAIILVALSFVGLPLSIRFMPDSGPDDYHILPVALFVGGPIAVMLLAMIANKLLQLRRAARWPSAPGRITKSGIAVSHRSRSGQRSQLINLPAIEYQFLANGKTYTGRRVGIGEDSGGANSESTLARYPVGAGVTVFYDPVDPEDCLLERDAPDFRLVQGCATTLASLASLGYIAYWITTRFDKVILPLWATGHGRVAIIASIIGLFSVMAYFGSLIIAKQKGAPWPSVNGVVVESRVESESRRAGRARAVFTPVVEYSYPVKDHEYRGRQIGPDDQSEYSLADAQSATSRFPKGRAVLVYYDPANPGDAMLERPAAARPDRIALAIAVVSFAVAIYAGKYLR